MCVCGWGGGRGEGAGGGYVYVCVCRRGSAGGGSRYTLWLTPTLKY